MLELIEKCNQSEITPEYYIIFIHGVCADANYLVPFIPALKLTKAAKFIFPNAPLRHLALKGGIEARAWYDINSLDPDKYIVDNNGIDSSVAAIDHIINSLVEDGISSRKIFVAGFSQGGAIAYTVSLKTQHKLAGVLALSTHLPNVSELAKIDSINKETPIFAIHGTEDNVIPYALGRKVYEQLKNAEFNILWSEYRMKHKLCAEAFHDMHHWFESISNHNYILDSIEIAEETEAI